MTRFRSSHLVFAGLLTLGGCETASGVQTSAIAAPQIAAAYIPLHKRVHLGIDSDDGAAMVIAPGVAVTCAHNANLVDPASVIGKATLSDLLFFRVRRSAPPVFAVPVVGEQVTAYGQGGTTDLRLASGTVRRFVSVPGYARPAYFLFAANAGPGFSGGPVVDGQGRLAGITFAYEDRGERLILAYDMNRVMDELAAFPKRAN